MSASPVDRRTLLKTALAGLIAVPAAGLVKQAAAAQGAAPRLDLKDPVAVVMAYTHDAKTAADSKVPQYKPGSKCSNCVQLQGKEGDEWRPCNLFPGKLVHADGWCKVWTLKPGAKV